MSRLDETPRIHETDMTLVDYTRSLLIPDDDKTGFHQLDDLGELEVWSLHGYAGFTRLEVDLCPHGDHDDARALVIKRMGQHWRPFAIAFNPEDEWQITHWEPVETARPL